MRSATASGGRKRRGASSGPTSRRSPTGAGRRAHQAERLDHAVPREPPVGAGELPERHVAVAQHQARPVVLGARLERGEAGLAEHVQHPLGPEGLGQLDRRERCSCWPARPGAAPARAAAGRSCAAARRRRPSPAPGPRRSAPRQASTRWPARARRRRASGRCPAGGGPGRRRSGPRRASSRKSAEPDVREHLAGAVVDDQRPRPGRGGGRRRAPSGPTAPRRAAAPGRASSAPRPRGRVRASPACRRGRPPGGERRTDAPAGRGPGPRAAATALQLGVEPPGPAHPTEHLAHRAASPRPGLARGPPAPGSGRWPPGARPGPPTASRAGRPK